MDSYRPDVTVKMYSDLSEVRLDWCQLTKECSFSSPFLEYEWAVQWGKYLLPRWPNGKPNIHVVVVYQNGEVIGIVPFYLSPPERRGGAVRLRQFGDLIQD